VGQIPWLALHKGDWCKANHGDEVIIDGRAIIDNGAVIDDGAVVYDRAVIVVDGVGLVPRDKVCRRHGGGGKKTSCKV
jgi:UDP-3-O-[3-hydroxymyristoyl] glucosamine N-acyltransferase